MNLGNKSGAGIQGCGATAEIVAPIARISFAVLVAVALGTGNANADRAVKAFGMSAANASEQADKNAPAKLDGAESSDAWLYLGRRSADRWMPPSISISDPSYPVKPGDTVVVKQDALVYGSVDCKVIAAADFKADGTSRSVLLVRADQKGLEIAGLPIECASIGGAKTVWANVKIPAVRLVSVEK